MKKKCDICGKFDINTMTECNECYWKGMRLELLKWLRAETEGLKKDFDKNRPMFSYNDIAGIKE